MDVQANSLRPSHEPGASPSHALLPGKDRAARVLVVDDDEIDYRRVQRLLAAGLWGRYDCTRARNFNEAMTLAGEGGFDIALIDYLLGGKSGLDLVQALGGESSNVPLVLLTGHSSRAIDAAALNAGVCDYLDKQSLSTELLERSIRYAMTHARNLQSLRAARDEAEEASRKKSDFLACMSHEIRTPLAGLLGALQFLRKIEADPENRSMIDGALNGGKMLVALCNDILDAVRFDNKQMRIKREDVDISRAVHEAVKLFEAAAQQKHLALRVIFAPDLPAILTCDGLRLRQLLTNLISNAIKFTQEGAVSVHVRETQLDVAGGCRAVEFAVQDTGMGIQPDGQRQLFKAFQQVHSALTRDYGGAGLGLYICRRLTEFMQGEIGVESEYGRGSRFWFRLPLDAAAG